MPDLDTFTPDKLLAGNQQAQTKQVVILTGASVNLVRGAILGKIAAGAVPTTGTAGANTGNGTMTGVAGKRRVKVGVYIARCKQVGTNLAIFEIRNPNNVVLGIARLGEAFTSDELDLTINDGGTDFVVGDSFTVTVPAGSNKYALVDKAAINGSGVAECILAEDADARSADVTTIAYITGQFNRAGVSMAAANVIGDHEADLRVNDINFKDVMA